MRTLIAVMIGVVTSVAGGQTVKELVERFPAQSAAEGKELVEKLAAKGAPAVSEIAGMINDLGKGDDLKARLALHALALRAGEKGSDDFRKQFAEAMATAKTNSQTLTAHFSDECRVAGIASPFDYKPEPSKVAKGDAGYEAMAAIAAEMARARKLVESDQRGQAEKIYRQILKDHPDQTHVRCAAIQGLAEAAPEKAFDEVFAAIGSDAADVRAVALEAARGMPGRKITRELLALVPKSKPDRAAQIIETLARRGDADALDGMLILAKHEDQTIRHAAIAALPALGSENVVGALVAMLAEDRDRQAAERALARVPGKAATSVIAQATPQSLAKTKASLLSVLAARGAAEAQPLMLEALAEKDSGVRQAAINALALVGDQKAQQAIIELVKQTDDDAARGAAENAILGLARLTPNGNQRISPILAALPDSKIGARAVFLRVLGRLGGENALSPIRAAVSDGDAAVRDAGIRALANWPEYHDAVAGDLLKVAQQKESPTHAVLALRAYIRLAGQRDLAAQQRLSMYKSAMEGATRGDEKKLVIAGLSDLNHADGLALLAAQLDDPAVAAEAASAAVKLARDIKAPNDAAKAVMVKAAAVASDEKVKRDAEKMVEKFGK
jgi:HEAT repeat protein